VDALGDAGAHEPLSMMWLAAVEAECVERGTTLEEVADIF